MRSRLIMLVAVMMLIAACGDETGAESEAGGGEGGGSPTTLTVSDGDGSQGSEDGSVQEKDPADTPPTPSSDSGATFTVDGESFSGDLYSCDPSDGAGDAAEGDLELVLLSGDDKGLSIDVWYNEVRDGNNVVSFVQMNVTVRVNRTTDSGPEQYSSQFDHDVDGNWTRIEAANASVALDGPPVTVEGGRISGELTLPQDHPQDATGTVVVAFDLEIPELSC